MIVIGADITGYRADCTHCGAYYHSIIFLDNHETKIPHYLDCPYALDEVSVKKRKIRASIDIAVDESYENNR